MTPSLPHALRALPVRELKERLQAAGIGYARITDEEELVQLLVRGRR